MTPTRRQFVRLSGALAALPALARFARAQAQTHAYPTRPVRIIVPFAPGGPTDVGARLIAQKLSESLGRNFFVENIGGASGNIGTAQAAKATPDGYTILINVNNQVINPFIFERVSYDPFKDFQPITRAVSFASALSVHPSIAANSVSELVALIKVNPKKYSYASPGLGTPSHLLGEQFRLSLGLDLVHVPYNGSGPAIASAVAGHTPIAFAGLAAAAPHVRDGKLRALAVMSKTRSQTLLEVPTIAEAGYPDLDGDGWVGAFAPTGTPQNIVGILHREIVAAITAPDTKERLIALGLEPVGSTPEEFARELRQEADKWEKVIRIAGIRAG